jgi:autotransporter translocation and assembly factor TamB
MRGRRPLLIAVLAAILVVAVVAAAHDAVAGLGIRAAVGALGYDLSAQRMRVGTSSLSIVAPVVRNRAGEPVLSADRLDVAFSLRALLPGSTHRFGLESVDLQRPRLTLIHHADGTYNVALPGASGAPARPDNTPVDVRVRVRDGEVALLDRFVEPNRERRESLTGVNVDARLAPTDPAYYRVDATLQDGARTYPIRGRGRFDHRRGFASQHWHANEIPVGPLVNFAIATHAIHIVDGRLRNVDARVYGFIGDAGDTVTHTGGSAELVDGKIFAAQLRVPIGDAHGMLHVYDDGVTTTGIDATLANVPLHLAGGIYGLSHPQLRFLVTGRGPLAKLRTISDQSLHRPIDGDVTFALRADGPIDKPVVRGTFSAPRIAYQRYVLSDAAGTVAFSGEDFQVVGAGARYGPLALRAHGALALGKHVGTDLLATVDGPGDALPYAATLLPHAAVHALVHLTGTDEQLAARGAVSAVAPHGTLDAPFSFAPDGTGSVGPLALARADGASLYAHVAYDRPHQLVDGVVSARHLVLLPAARTHLPGLNVAALPPVAGTLDADLAGELHGAALADASGSVHVRNARAAGLALGDADAHLAGNASGIALTGVRVHGPLADVRGEGAYATDGALFALRGRVVSSFDRLAPLLRGVRAHGGIDAPVRVVASNGRTVLQIADARFAGAHVQGVPLRGAAATVALRGSAFDVQAARLDAAGGSVVANGSFGNGGSMRVSASGIDASALRGAGVRVRGGRIAAIATVSGTQRDPRANAGVALSGATYGGAPLAATASGAYAGGRLSVRQANLAYDGAVADASGTVSNLTARPRVDVAAHVRGADVGTFAHRFNVPLRYPDAAVDADVRVQGALASPSLAGSARIAAGSINGLNFRDVVLPLSGDLAAVDVRGGRATVGSTTVRFDALASRAGASGTVRSDRVDLADFNDYFDSADTLAGRGRLAVSFATGRSTLATSGTVALADARYRRLPIGDVAANWSSHGRTISGSANVGGPHGRLIARGSATVPARDPLARIRSSALDAQATLAGVDLTTWLPAAGIIAPVTGRVDGALRVRGVAPQLALAGNASLHDGNVGRIPIARLDVAASGDRNRTRITTAHLEALNLVADGSGSFGLRANDPVQLALHATSPDIGAFAARATGKTLDASGALDTTLTIGGTRRAPVIRDVADVANPRYGRTRATHAHSDVAYANGRLTLRDASLDLIAGRLALSGSVPATLAPPFVDRRNAAVSARLVADRVDVGQFADLLPKDTKIGGIVNGDVAVAGAMRDPLLSGNLGLDKGSYVSPQLASMIRNGTLQLAFAGHAARLSALHADIGGGAVDGSGTVRVGDLRDAMNTLAFDVRTREKNVGLDLPKLFRGKIDGTLALRRTAGTRVLLAGDLTVAHARIPLSALLPSNASTTPSGPPLPVAFALNVAATNDDRVQGPAVDIGAKGDVAVSGTLAHPALSGAMDSTDGTISFYRTFVLQSGHVAFDPSSGIIPDVDATATTHVPDPSTDVLLHVHGPATGLAIDFASNPNYDRGQIVGLLVGAQNLGAVYGVARTTPSPAGGGNALQNVAVGYIDQRFTQTLFQPFSSSLGQALGFSTFNLNAGLTGGFSASATRQLGKNLQASFSDASTAAGQQQSFALSMNMSDASSMQLTLFSAGTQARALGGATPFAPDGPVNYQLQALAPTPGTSGYVFTYVHKFWTAKQHAPPPSAPATTPAATAAGVR